MPPVSRPTASLETGRIQQKARTRKALVDAAIAFVRDGQDFSVGDVADAALVGRATAYTYFKTKESLRAQAVLTFVASNDFPSFEIAFAQTGDAEKGCKDKAKATYDAEVTAAENKKNAARQQH